MYFCKKIKMKIRVILAFILLMLMPFPSKAQTFEEPVVRDELLLKNIENND